MTPRRPLPPALRGRLFTVAEARELDVARSRLRGSSTAHPFRGVYGEACADDSLLSRAFAVARILPPSARFSHATAALLLGAPIRPTDDLHVTVPRGQATPRRRPGLITHERLRPDDPVLVAGVAVTSPAQTFIDLAPTLSLDDLVVLGDYFVRHQTTAAALAAHVAASPRGTRGVVRARQALALVREGVDSPPETRLRLAVVRDGLPEPAVNPVVRDAAGEWLGKPDLGHLRAKVATQVEGDVHRTTRRRWRQDIARDEAFRDNGWIVLRTTSDDVHHPGPYLQRLRSALRRRGEDV